MIGDTIIRRVKLDEPCLLWNDLESSKNKAWKALSLLDGQSIILSILVSAHDIEQNDFYNIIFLHAVNHVDDQVLINRSEQKRNTLQLKGKYEEKRKINVVNKYVHEITSELKKNKEALSAELVIMMKKQMDKGNVYYSLLKDLNVNFNTNSKDEWGDLDELF